MIVFKVVETAGFTTPGKGRSCYVSDGPFCYTYELEKAIACFLPIFVFDTHEHASWAVRSHTQKIFECNTTEAFIPPLNIKTVPFVENPINETYIQDFWHKWKTRREMPYMQKRPSSLWASPPEGTLLCYNLLPLREVETLTPNLIVI